MAWKIEVYTNTSGHEVVRDFISNLQKSSQAKLLRLIDLLEQYGPALSMPHTKPMGDSLYELRVRGKQEVRVFYVFALSIDIYLLHGFIKKTQSTPKRELDIARQRQTEVLNKLSQ